MRGEVDRAHEPGGPAIQGTITVSTDTYTIASVDLDYMVHTLAILRTEPDDAGLAALENIKASVRDAEVAAPQGCPVVVAGAEPNELHCQDGLFAMEVTPQGFGSRCRRRYVNKNPLTLGRSRYERTDRLDRLTILIGSEGTTTPLRL